MNLGLLWVAAALVVAAVVGVMAVRRPILFRMASRNALRRPKQTATVIAGLMIGTAIISAALVAGQSATSAIRGAVYDALGETDEAIRMEGFHFFPDLVVDAFLNDPDVAGEVEAIGPNVIWGAAADNPRTDLFEPTITLLGHDPILDQPFGPFGLRGGGSVDGTGLGQGEAIINAELADALELRVGDTIQVAYTLPVDPLLPTVEIFGGVLGPSIDPGLLVPLPDLGALPARATHTFDVPGGATDLSLILFCGGPDESCPDGTTLRLDAIAPDGTTTSVAHRDPASCVGQTACPPTPDPLWLNRTGDPTLDDGAWTLRVTGQVSAQTPYGLVAVALEPVYDLAALQERAQALEDLADEAEAFLDVDLFGERETADLRVVAISDSGRGVQFDLGPTAFMDLGTLQTLLHREGQVNYLKFSNPGGIEAGAAGTDDAVRVLNATLRDLKETYPDVASIQALELKPIKAEFLRVADDAGQLMTGLMIFAGSLSVITGLLLIVNIFTMLAEERRSELGMARAVGLSRKDVVRLFLFEGSLYAVAAAAVGAILGLGLAYLMIEGLNAFIANRGSDFPPVPFAPSPTAVPIAFATGALLTFVTIFFASRRQSRLNIVRAIRQIDEPPKSGRPWMVWVGTPLAAIGLLLSVAGWWTSQFSLQVFGPLGIAAGIMVALRPSVPRRFLDPIVAALLAVYYIVTIFVISEFENLQEANIVGPMRGVIMTLCLVVLITYWRAGPRALGHALARVKRLRAIAIPAVAYPQHKRFRTGMTLAMFAIVILSVGFFSIFGGLFQVDPARHTGGFEVEGRTTLDVEDLDASDRGLLDESVVRSRHRVADAPSLLPDFITVNGERTGHFGPPEHHVYGIDRSFLDVQEFRLLWTLDGLSQDETYQRLFDEPGTIIVGYQYSTDEQGQDLAHDVGETLTIHAGDCFGPFERPDRPSQPACPSYTIIGIQEQYHFPGVWLPRAEMEGIFPQHQSLWLYDLEPGTDAAAFAKDLERNHRDVGMDADASQELVAEEQQAFRQILAALKVFLGLGLLVGVLSLGIITSRSVLERRQEIGMLRALGYTGRMVRRIFFIEVTLIILVGAVIGILSSIIVTYGLWYAIIRELQYPYTIPWAEIGLLLGISYVVALIATAAPILRAAKVAPAEALRYIE